MVVYHILKHTGNEAGPSQFPDHPGLHKGLHCLSVWDAGALAQGLTGLTVVPLEEFHIPVPTGQLITMCNSSSQRLSQLSSPRARCACSAGRHIGKLPYTAKCQKVKHKYLYYHI